MTKHHVQFDSDKIHGEQYIKIINSDAIVTSERLNVTTEPAKQVHLEWNPKEDITTYELAKCMPFLINHTFLTENMIPDEYFMRHFKITKY